MGGASVDALRRATDEQGGGLGADRALGYQPALDGMRAVAVGAVLAYHAGAGWLPGGFLGVSAFFTLSGFLITRLLLDEHADTGTIDVRAFWVRRLRRLWPASIACLLAITVAAHWAATATQRITLQGDVIASLVSLVNWRFIAGHQTYAGMGADPSPVQHYWSLAVEEQVYLVLPVVLALLLGRRRRPVGRTRLPVVGLGLLATLVASCVALAIVYHPGDDIARAYYGTDVRVAEVLVGCLLGLATCARGMTGLLGRPLGRHHRRLTALAVVGVAAAWGTAHVTSVWLYRGGLVTYAAAIATIILAALRPGPVRRILGLGPLVWLGSISFGVYLVHWPVFLWVDGLPGRPLRGPALILLRLALTLAIAQVSYLLLEQPIRSRRAVRTRRLVIALPGVALVTALLVVVAVPVPSVAHGPNAVAKVVLTQAARRAPLALAEQGVPHSPIGRPLRLLVAGDSLAYQVGYGALPWFQKYPGRFAPIEGTAVPGCGVTGDGRVGPYDRSIRGLVGDGCETVLERNRVAVAAEHPDVALLISGVWDVADQRFGSDRRYRRPGDPIFDDHLVRDYQEIIDVLAAGGAMVVIAPWPCIAPDAHFDDGRALASGMSDARLAHLRDTLLPRVLASRSTKAVRIDFDRHLCADGRYRPTDAHGRLLRLSEGMHLSEVGLGYARDDLFPAILREARTWARAHPSFGSGMGT